MSQTRGRPRKFDETEVLEAALNVFWLKGYDAASLDDLAKAMGMNRPSIYRAFGDKEAIFLKTMEVFAQKLEMGFGLTMVGDDDIRTRLKAFLSMALDVYTGGDMAKGCLIMSTAITAAPENPKIRELLLSIIRFIDEKMAEAFVQAEALGQLDCGSISASSRSALAQSVLHSLALRARAGDDKALLINMIDDGVHMLTA